MSSQNYISDAISNYYFQSTIPRTSSLATIQPTGKQNMCIVRNQHQPNKQNKTIEYWKHPMQQFKINTAYSSNSHISQAPPQKATYSTKLIPYAYSLERNLVKEKRCDSVASQASQKKSVKFVDGPEAISEPVRKPVLNRTRSNSILKCRSMSKDSNKIRQNSEAKQKYASDCFRDHKNAAILQRYKQIINQLGRQSKLRIASSIQPKHIQSKFVDSAFPPLHQSISKTSHLSRITWKRISEMNISNSIINRKPGDISALKIICQREESYQISTMLNLIKKSSKLLNFLFEDSIICDKGAFIVKIFQENEWKYIIIDDYIPIEDKSGILQPAFIKVQGKQCQIWPLLLHKAYASYMGSYELLHQLSLHSLFSDLLRLPTQTYQTDENTLNAFFCSIAQEVDHNCIFYGQRKETINGRSAYKILRMQKYNQKIIIFEQCQDRTLKQMQMNELRDHYKEITRISIPHLQNCSSVDFVGPNNIGRQVKNKYLMNSSPPGMTYEQSISKIMVKTFNVAKMTHFSFIVKNYDKNQRRKNSNSWFRVFLFQKELDSYRWIAGKYSNTIISFTCTLEAGLYYLLLLPDWGQENNLNFCVTTYGKHLSIRYNPDSQFNVPNIIQKGCSDLAQRIGKMTQINKWICTYTLVHADAGLIIENINNERRNGSIRIFRAIKNLKTKNCQIIPLNKEFYLMNSLRLKDEAQLTIEKQECASVVLFFFNGYDADFLKNFNFGL